VFRAAVLSIVLTLAVGPSANLLCSVWCHSEDATSAACEYQNAPRPPRVTGEDSCPTASASAAAFVREEAKKGASPAVHLTDSIHTREAATFSLLQSPPS
jgi:hypothetical protein